MTDESQNIAGHAAHADRVRRAVLRSAGASPLELRAAALSGAASGAIAPLVERIRISAPDVTDEQIVALVLETGSESAAFEIMMAASIGAGLDRWDAAVTAIREARDAAV